MLSDTDIDPEKVKACGRHHSGMSQKPIWEDLGLTCWLVGTDAVITMVSFFRNQQKRKGEITQ